MKWKKVFLNCALVIGLALAYVGYIGVMRRQQTAKVQPIDDMVWEALERDGIANVSLGYEAYDKGEVVMKCGVVVTYHDGRVLCVTDEVTWVER